MNTIRVYIAGPISGIPERNMPAFEVAAASLRAAGYEVVSPLEVNPEPTDWNTAMRKDIPHLCRCDAIVLLPGWEKSRGTRIEFGLAVNLNLSVMTLADALAQYAEGHPA
jgi:nucleoside 2-deoxyribosyltransferase